MVTRTKEYRETVKDALKPSVTLRDRIVAVLKIDCFNMTWTGDDVRKINIHHKRASYQCVQALSCVDGFGRFSKDDLARFRPGVRVFLYRETASRADYVQLNALFRELVDVIEARAVKGLIDLDECEVGATDD